MSIHWLKCWLAEAIGTQILKAVAKKQAKGAAPYAQGKELVVFLDVGGAAWLRCGNIVRAPAAEPAATAGETGPCAGWDVSGWAPAHGGVKPSSVMGRWNSASMAA